MNPTKTERDQWRGGIMSEELTLLPCPLCGHSAYTERGLIETFVGMAEVWRVSCDKVGCPVKTPLFDTLKEAMHEPK